MILLFAWCTFASDLMLAARTCPSASLLCQIESFRSGSFPSNPSQRKHPKSRRFGYPDASQTRQQNLGESIIQPGNNSFLAFIHSSNWTLQRISPQAIPALHTPQVTTMRLSLPRAAGSPLSSPDSLGSILNAPYHQYRQIPKLVSTFPQHYKYMDSRTFLFTACTIFCYCCTCNELSALRRFHTGRILGRSGYISGETLYKISKTFVRSLKPGRLVTAVNVC